jgi:hypothetical protein
MYYPNSGPDYYNGPVGPGASVPNFPGLQAPYSAGEQPSQPGTVAHESNGTVYFYDANQMYSGSGYSGPAPPRPGSGSGPGGVVGMGGMMTPPGTTFYYPQQQSGYYGQWSTISILFDFSFTSDPFSFPFTFRIYYVVISFESLDQQGSFHFHFPLPFFISQFSSSHIHLHDFVFFYLNLSGFHGISDMTHCGPC